jgi:hypothetical protein
VRIPKNPSNLPTLPFLRFLEIGVLPTLTVAAVRKRSMESEGLFQPGCTCKVLELSWKKTGNVCEKRSGRKNVHVNVA